ncbi:MAG: anaerobic ribonucleoside-triphosphate reductase activating protein [Oscillospiraceae bacterium]|nr:anaerobic ribonucleoside-triphosphate reductase activating protein [Oscillospiraceae bacterium]
MKIRLFGTQNDSIVDGPGIRYAVFVQGCIRKCKGCHNPGSHDMNGGYLTDTDEILEEIKKNPLLDGVTFSGGEPFLQPLPLIKLAEDIKNLNRGLDIIVYTGYTIEEILSGADDKNRWSELMRCIDILVDGPFAEELRSVELTFKGSSNQRIINVPETLVKGKIVCVDL